MSEATARGEEEGDGERHRARARTRSQRRAALLHEIAEVRELRRRLAPRRWKLARARAVYRRRTFRW